jgi:hypothetical protein
VCVGFRCLAAAWCAPCPPRAGLACLHHPRSQLRKLITENFEEWGPLENVNVIPMKTIAFVR